MDFSDFFGSPNPNSTENGSSLVDLLDSFLEMPVEGSKMPEKPVSPPPVIAPVRKSKRTPKPTPKKAVKAKKVTPKRQPKQKIEDIIKKEPEIEIPVSDEDEGTGQDNWQNWDGNSDDDWPMEPNEIFEEKKPGESIFSSKS